MATMMQHDDNENADNMNTSQCYMSPPKYTNQQICQSQFKSARYSNFNDIFNIIIKNDCMIFGGAVRDLIFRDYWIVKYKIYCNTQKHLGLFDDPNFHPISYNGRTLIANDYDVFIDDIEKYNNLKKYFDDNFIYKIFNVDENLETSKYFMASNPLMKSILQHKCIIIKGHKINKGTLRVINSITGPLSSFMIDNIKNNINLKIDIIILDKDWEIKTQGTYSKKDVSPPFRIPDFRCNLVCAIKNNNEKSFGDSYVGNYKIVALWNCIKPIDYIFNPNPLLNIYDRQLLNISLQQHTIANLKIIIDDIINKIAMPLDNTNSYVFYTLLRPANHRIRKMAAKEYKIILEPFTPKARISRLCHKTNTLININSVITDDDKCVVCYNPIKGEENILYTCMICNSFLHVECWVKCKLNDYHNIEGGKLLSRCIVCRQYEDFCQNEYISNNFMHHIWEDPLYGSLRTCDFINIISNISHIQNRLAGTFIPIDCKCCNARNEYVKYITKGVETTIEPTQIRYIHYKYDKHEINDDIINDDIINDDIEDDIEDNIADNIADVVDNIAYVDNIAAINVSANANANANIYEPDIGDEPVNVEEFNRFFAIHELV